MNNIIFLGAPGSGKGTQALTLSKMLSIPSISTGNILRLEVEEETCIGLEAKEYIDSGSLVPDFIVMNIIKKNISQPFCKNGFILDGFPRNINQAINLEEVLQEINKRISKVIYLDVPRDIIFKRISGRISCKDCGASYNIYFSPTKVSGVCDECKSTNLISRSDDNEKSINRRLEVYNSDTKELISHYSKKDLIYKVDGLKNIDLVTKDILKGINLSNN